MKLLVCAIWLATLSAAAACEPEAAVSRISANSFAVTLFSFTACDVSRIQVELGDLESGDTIELGSATQGFALTAATEGERSRTSILSANGERFVNGTLFVITNTNSAAERRTNSPRIAHVAAWDSFGRAVTISVPESSVFASESIGGSDVAWSPSFYTVVVGSERVADEADRSAPAAFSVSEPRLRALAQTSSSTQIVCGSLPPQGWITISVNGVCSKNGASSYIGRTIQRIDTLAAGTALTVCGDVAPEGWITTAVSGQYCAQLNSYSYIGRTIKRIDGLAAGTALTVCGDAAPAGWITTAVSGQYCARLNSYSYIGRTIKRIDGLAAGTVLTVCGDVAPAGWITTAVSSQYCAQLNSYSYIGRTIKRIDALSAGAALTVCGDVAPAGWITTAISGQYCAQLNSFSYIGRTIERIDTLKVGTSLGICGDVPPSGWVTTSVSSAPCARLGSFTYTGRTIRRIQ